MNPSNPEVHLFIIIIIIAMTEGWESVVINNKNVEEEKTAGYKKNYD